MLSGTDQWLQLGEVTVPSGIVVITDMGYLGSWSGRMPPSSVPDQITDPDLRASIAAAQDFRLVGPDANAAARAVGLQSLTFVYDIPRHGLPTILARYEEAIKSHGFDAKLELETRRVPHRVRAQRAADAGGADFTIDGVWSVAVGGLPTAQRLTVVGRPHDYGAGVGIRWADVAVVVEEGLRFEEGARIGVVGVDWARLIIIDADALTFWVHERALDGLADVAYWGRDAASARNAFGGSDLEDASIGWENLDARAAAELAVRIEQWRDDGDHKLAVDYRPHSHHYQVVRQVRRGDLFGVGSIEVGGAKALGFATSWGDGIFPVSRAGSVGRTSSLRIQLGDEERGRRTRDILHPELA